METITTFSLLTYFAAQPYSPVHIDTVLVTDPLQTHCPSRREKNHGASHRTPAHQHKDNIKSIDHPETLTGGQS